MTMTLLTSIFSGKAGKAGAPAIDRAILEEAANWFVHLKDGTESARDRVALEQWLIKSEHHRHAWELVQQLDQHLGSVPSELALPALTHHSRSRRQTVKLLMALLTTGTVGLTAYQTLPLDRWRADYATAPGQRRTVTLSDGSLLEMNTDTIIDVVFDDARRLIRLHRGEVLIQTGKDVDHAGIAPRSFMVETVQGSVRALGTRFSVRYMDDAQVQVVVFEHAVEVMPVKMPQQTMRIDNDQQIVFNGEAVGVARTAASHQDAWTHDMLVAVDQRMDEFLKEVARYRRGIVQCDPEVAALRVTGSYRLDDLDASLESLAFSHPVEVTFLTRFLVKVRAKT
jgi:transmembrane sensor